MASSIGGRLFCCLVLFYGLIQVHGKPVFALIGIFSYTADMTTDLIVAWGLFVKGEILYGCLVLFFIYIPMLLSTQRQKVTDCFLYHKIMKLGPSYRPMARLIFFVFYFLAIISVGAALTPFTTMVTGLIATCRGLEPDNFVGHLKLLEPVFESFPQSILQTIIVFKSLPEYEISQIVSILVSLFAIGFAISTNGNFEGAASSSKVIYFFVIPLSVASKAVVGSMLGLIYMPWVFLGLATGWIIYFILEFVLRMFGAYNCLAQPNGEEQQKSVAGGRSDNFSCSLLPCREESHGSRSTVPYKVNPVQPYEEQQRTSNIQEKSDVYISSCNWQCLDTKHHHSIVSVSGDSIFICVPINEEIPYNPINLNDKSTEIQSYSDVVTSSNFSVMNEENKSNNYQLLQEVGVENRSAIDKCSLPSSINENQVHTTIILIILKAFYTTWVGAPFDSFTPTGLIVSFYVLSISLVGLNLDVPLPVIIIAITLASISFIINGMLVMVPQVRYVVDDWQCGVENWLAANDDTEIMEMVGIIFSKALLLIIVFLTIILLFYLV